ncbi:uncharacterized protein [Nicotiana sylvestris]|uniref:uncharacterized protein n=1 Tax=Nicotiana sylvestris TaxID=4096 RepID=UPI00388C3F31
MIPPRNDASTLFEEAQHLLSRAIVKFRAELRQCEAELRKVSGEEKAMRLICDQKLEELKDLRLQQKLEMIGQLRGEVDQVRADYHKWKKNMDQLATDKKAITAQHTSTESQLQGLKEKVLAQARKIEELEAELARSRDEVVHAKATTEKMKVAADKSIIVYLRDVAAVQAELREASDREKWSNDLAKCQARRETLEEIHARGFNLVEEIAEAKARENDARFHVSSDDEDAVSGSRDGEGEEGASEEGGLSKDKLPKAQFLRTSLPGMWPRK